MSTLKRRVIAIKSNEELLKHKEEAENITLEMMLTAREKRVERQNLFLKNCNTLICFTMNIAGPYKFSPLIRQVADEGEEKLKEALSLNGISFGNVINEDGPCGVERYLFSEEDPYKIKEITSEIEEHFPL